MAVESSKALVLITHTHTGLVGTLLLHNAKKVAKKCNFGGNGISNTQFLVPHSGATVCYTTLYVVLLLAILDRRSILM